MVQVWVDVVDTDGVDAQHLHEGGVTEAVILEGQSILSRVGVVASAATRLVGDANDLEAVASGVVDEVVALDADGRDGGGQRGGAEEAQDGLHELASVC